MPEDSSPSQTRIRFSQYLLAVVVPVVFAVVALVLLTGRFNTEIAHAEEERRGVEYILRLYGVMVGLQKVQGLRQIALRDWEAIDFRVDTVLEGVERDLNELTGHPLSVHFRTRREASDLLLAVRDRREGGGQGGWSADYRFYAARITQVRHLIRLTAHRSRLVLDPEYPSFYLMALLTDQMPALMIAMGEMRGLTAAYLSADEVSTELEGDARDRIHRALLGLQETLEQYRLIMETEPELGPGLRPLLRETSRGVHWLVGRTRAVLSNDRRSVGPSTYFTEASEVIDECLRRSEEVGGLLEERLVERGQRLRTRRAGGVLAVIGALGVMLIGFTVFYRTNRDAMRRLEAYGRDKEVESITDPLTNLYNRRYCDLSLGRELNRARRDGEAFTYAILDVDRFKHYNDTHGHQAGDEVLRRIAGAMRDTLRRAGDFLFRIGGEEFCFFATDMTVEEAHALADYLRRAVEGLHMVNDTRWENPYVTISIGVCHLDAVHEEDPDSVVRKADDALYRAKGMGRNRVEMAPPE